MYTVLRHFLMLLVMFLVPGLAVGEEYAPGVHYEVLKTPVPVAAGKPEIVEVFNFKCGHCNHFRPIFDAWAVKNKDRVNIKHLPIYWGQQTDMPVRAFYTAEFMGKGEEMRTALFKSQFEDKKEIENKDIVIKLAEGIGLDGKQFAANLPSFGVAGKLAQAQRLHKAYNVESTPLLIVNGSFKIDGNRAGGDLNKMLQIAESLLGKGL